jgi:excisionase family DNA binding protein
MPERLAYSVDEAAEIIGVSRDHIYDLLRTGLLGSVKSGRRRLITKGQLEGYLASQECAA